jgi:hypothetical protein
VAAARFQGPTGVLQLQCRRRQRGRRIRKHLAALLSRFVLIKRVNAPKQLSRRSEKSRQFMGRFPTGSPAGEFLKLLRRNAYRLVQECGNRPDLLVRLGFSESRHAGHVYDVFGNPEHLYRVVVPLCSE